MKTLKPQQKLDVGTDPALTQAGKSMGWSLRVCLMADLIQDTAVIGS
jgi:hypothetical protein